ncbi:MAG: hypothetical protein VZS44_03095 [Bacilli bacterium]|nr:hypothetical protein [Bacilli bacterium]
MKDSNSQEKHYYYDTTKEDKDKRKIKYLLLLLLLTGLLLSTTTYAWFTTNRVVSVEMINVRVQTEGSLEISVDGINWKPGITQDEIIAAHGTTYTSSTNQLPAFIEPVSTVGTLSNNGFMDMYLGIISSNETGDYIITSQKSIETEGNGDSSTGKFVAFDIFLKITETKPLYLTSESRVVYNGTSTGTENAIRVAFVIEGSTTSGSDINTIQSLRTTDRNNVYIWEPNYNTHTLTGVSNAREVYGLNISENHATRLNYDGIKAEFPETANVTFSNAKVASFPNYFETVTPRIQTVKNYTEYQPLWNLEGGITKVRVYFWLEGQDVDCENNASAGDLSFRLQFSTNPAA